MNNNSTNTIIITMFAEYNVSTQTEWLSMKSAEAGCICAEVVDDSLVRAGEILNCPEVISPGLLTNGGEGGSSRAARPTVVH